MERTYKVTATLNGKSISFEVDAESAMRAVQIVNLTRGFDIRKELGDGDWQFETEEDFL
jgi:hypothetical protein